MSDRRCNPREEVSAELLCCVGNDTFAARLKNLSPTGAFFETGVLFDPTHAIRLAIDLPGKGSVAATGRATRVVAARDYRVGVAVQFVEAPEE